MPRQHGARRQSLRGQRLEMHVLGATSRGDLLQQLPVRPQRVRCAAAGDVVVQRGKGVSATTATTY